MEHSPPLEAYPFNLNEEGFSINRYEAEAVVQEIGARVLTDPDVVPAHIHEMGVELKARLELDKARRIGVALHFIGPLEEYYRDLTVGLKAHGMGSSKYRRYVDRLGEYRQRLLQDGASSDTVE